MPLEMLLDLEVVDSKVGAAFEQSRNKPARKKVYIDQIL